MGKIIDRLRFGQRWWAAELVARLFAVIHFGVVMLCWTCLCSKPGVLPEASVVPDPCSPTQFALASLAFVAGSGGLALMIEGPGLFRLVPYPRRRLF